MSRIGVEIGPEALRAVRVGQRTFRTFEVEWDPDVPAPAVAALAQSLGSAGSVAAVIHPDLLRVRRIELPPLPVAERRRALELEPDRHFAVGEPLVFSLPGNDDVVFAAPGSQVDAWIAALRELGPLTRLEPSAVALGRALVACGAPADVDVLRHGPDGVEWTAFRDGRLSAARRLFGGLDAAVADPSIAGSGAPRLLDPPVDADARPLPVPDGLDPRFLAAWGATLATGTGWEDGFLTAPLQRRLVRRERVRVGRAVLALVAALVFLLLSWDAYRGRVEARLDARIAELQARAAPVLELQREVRELEGALAALDEVRASRSDILGTLQVLSAGIPGDTWLRSIHVVGTDWQIDGVGRDAAALVPLLETHPAIEDVRFAAATARIQTENGSYDNFTLAFRATRPADGP